MHIGVISVYIGLVPVYVGVVGVYIGLVPVYIGVVSVYIGLVPVYIGLLSVYIGLVSGEHALTASDERRDFSVSFTTCTRTHTSAYVGC